MGTQERVTYCRICEAACGIVATVQDGRITRLRPDPDHLLSRGYACPSRVRLSSRHGWVEVDVRVTDEMTPGAVAVPHGWGHDGGWRVANAAGGVNVNRLAGAGVDDIEPLAGMAFFNGIPVRMAPVGY